MTRKFIALACAVLLAMAPANAQPSDAQMTKVNALWLRAIDDWAPLLTCGATNLDSDKVIRGAWEQTRDKAIDAMENADWPKPELDKIRKQTNTEALRLPPETTFARLLDYCARHNDWVIRSIKIDVLPIGVEVLKVLKTGDAP